MTNFSKILTDVAKGFFIAVLYLELTKANDTNVQNILFFAFFYVMMVNGAHFVGVDPMTVTNAFITKTVFTLIDERIKRNDDGNVPNSK